jgi:hypothetical protein
MPKKKSSLMPTCHTFAFCDQILIDPETGKSNLIGLFNGITAISFPARHPRMHVFITLTNYQGEGKAKLTFFDPESAEIGSMEIDHVKCDDPSHMLDFNFTIKGMEFKKPGDYKVKFFVNSQLVASKNLSLIKVIKKEQQ